MSHRIYTTPGFVIESRPYGEAGKTLSIFTRDLGMVNAAAQGIRLAKSKLRYYAQDFSLSEFSLVRGRDIWRVVGAEKISPSDPMSHAAFTGGSELFSEPLFVRMLTVVRRLVQGEEKNEALFDAILAAQEFFLKNQPERLNALEQLDEKGISPNVEPIIMLRILHHLGYVQAKAELATFLADNSFDRELVEKMSSAPLKASAVKEINKALQESHL